MPELTHILGAAMVRAGPKSLVNGVAGQWNFQVLGGRLKLELVGIGRPSAAQHFRKGHTLG